MKKSKYRNLKVLSLILSVIMIMYSVPVTAVSATVESTEIAEDDGYVYDVMEPEEIELEATEIAQITEVESLREENVKHFKLPDGTYEMVVYGEAVHRKDSDGKWQDINNNLELTAVKNVNMFASSDMRTAFASSFSAGQPLMTLSENGYSVSMSLVSDNINSDVELMSISEPVALAIQNATVREKDAKFDTISQAAEINNKSSIKYQNVKANTDIEYVMSGNDIKENIIIKAKGTNYIYRFDLTLDGLTPELVNNTVILKDSESGEEQYMIPEPYMYDADGNISYSVIYALTNHGNGVYRLTVTADSSWINAEGRAFPVTVDPTLEVLSGFTCAYVDENWPNNVSGSMIATYVSRTKTSFIKFDINFPDNIAVNNATLKMKYYYNVSTGIDPMHLCVYGVPRDWTTSNLSYNYMQMPSLGYNVSSTNISYTEEEAAARPVARKDAEFDITDLADEWAINKPNYGVAIKCMNSTGNSEAMLVAELIAPDNLKPSININYTSYAGGFFIQNVATGMYIDIEQDDLGNASTESGAYAIQKKYSASDSQRWIIERVEYPSVYAGQTVIRSAHSGKYLGISYDDNVFLAQYDTIDDFNIWNLNWPPSNGTHIFEFIPTIPDAYTVAVPSPSSGEGTRIRQMYEEDMASDACDEWYIVSKVISMVNYYDNSFPETGLLMNTIDDAISFANAVYARYFNIGVFMDGEVQSFEEAIGHKSISDLCNNVGGHCYDTCDENVYNLPYINHHKDLYLLHKQLYDLNSENGIKREDDHIYVMYADANAQPNAGPYCKTYMVDETTQEIVHERVNWYASVWYSDTLLGRTSPVINFLHIEDARQKENQYGIIQACMIITLAHELAHTIGMPDVYDAENDEIPDNEKHDVIGGYVCIMEQFEVDTLSVTYYQNVLNGSAQPFCPSCMEKMNGFTSEYVSGQRQIIGQSADEEAI